MTLLSQVPDLKVALAKKDKEIHQLQVHLKEGLDQIRKFIRNPSDVVNKARLFDIDIRTEGQLSAPKIITILVNFRCKMEAVPVEIWKLVSGSQAQPSQPPFPSPEATP